MDEQKYKGFVVLQRTMLDWEWYTEANTMRLFVHLLLTVNHTPKQWHGITVNRGQRVASYGKLAAETGLSVKEVRTALSHLKKTGEVAHKATSKFGLFTVVNYNKYQSLDTQEGGQGAVRGQSRGSQGAVKGQQLNNENNENNEYIPPISPKGAKKDWPGFDDFYSCYPKHTGKQAALKAWNKLKPNPQLQQLIIKAVEKQKQSQQWTKDGGQFIPLPATWLNGQRWEDELEVEPIVDKPYNPYEGCGIVV